MTKTLCIKAKLHPIEDLRRRVKSMMPLVHLSNQYSKVSEDLFVVGCMLVFHL